MSTYRVQVVISRTVQVDVQGEKLTLEQIEQLAIEQAKREHGKDGEFEVLEFERVTGES